MKNGSFARRGRNAASLLLTAVLLAVCASCGTNMPLRAAQRAGPFGSPVDYAEETATAPATQAPTQAATVPPTQAPTAPPVTAAPTTEREEKTYTAKEIEDLIQGIWELPGGGYFTFFRGAITILIPGKALMLGTYKVDTSRQLINGTMRAINGTTQMQLHYGFSIEGDFLLYNNNYIALNKK